MRSRALALLAVVLAVPAFAEGPGSRLRTTPEIAVPQRDARRDAMEDQTRCARLPQEARQRCLDEARQSALERKPVGPDSTGVGSGAGSTATGPATGAGATGSGGTR